MPTDPVNGESHPTIPLSGWADRALRRLARLTGSPRIAQLSGATLLGERAVAGGFSIGGQVSPGPGGTRLLRTGDGGWLALTISRQDDREVLPALFGEALDITDDEAIARLVAQRACEPLVARGRLLGLALASADEVPVSPPVEVLEQGSRRVRSDDGRPLVVDLSAIWAGPLAGHLLWLAGAEVLKIESPARPDAMRQGSPGLFDLLNQGKANLALDLSCEAQKSALLALIRRADVVIESSRPRALRQFGIDAGALVREVPGLVWLSITGHGARGNAADWAGLGNDCGVAGGLSRALEESSGTIGLVGDAIADPLTGIVGATAAWAALKRAQARHIGLSMSAIAARALKQERQRSATALSEELRAWGNARGRPFPLVPMRTPAAPARPLGADNDSLSVEPARC